MFITWIQIHNKYSVHFLLTILYSRRLPSLLQVFLSFIGILINYDIFLKDFGGLILLNSIVDFTAFIMYFKY